MKQLKRELQAISKALAELTKKTEQMAGRLADFEKAPSTQRRKAVRRRPGRPAKGAVRRRSSGKTAINAVLNLINRSEKGVQIEDLRKETGISENNLRVSLYRLKKRGAIKNVGKGIYVKA